MTLCSSSQRGGNEEATVSNRNVHAPPLEEKYSQLAQEDWDAETALKLFAW